jgi:hypothetical protein
MPTYYPTWTESSWGTIAGGAWKSPGQIETSQTTYSLTVVLGRPPSWDPEPPPPPPDLYLISEADWSRIRFGTLDVRDPTVIHKDQTSYKVIANDNGGAKTAIVITV